MAKDVSERLFTTVSAFLLSGCIRRNTSPNSVMKRISAIPVSLLTRAVSHPTMYRGRLWTMRQFSGFGTAADTNERFHYLLKHGQTGLSVAFHLPTLMGHDSDHPMSEGEVGKCGVVALLGARNRSQFQMIAT